jgi:hypothetical protein
MYYYEISIHKSRSLDIFWKSINFVHNIVFIIRYILMLSPHLCVSLKNILIVYRFNDKNIFEFLISSHLRHTSVIFQPLWSNPCSWYLCICCRICRSSKVLRLFVLLVFETVSNVDFDMYMSYRSVISYDLAHRTYTVPSSWRHTMNKKQKL